MNRKYKRKKTTYNKPRTIIMTTLLVSVAFLLGLWFERSNMSLQWMETYAREIASHIRSVSFDFTGGKQTDKLGDYHFFDVGQGSAVLLEAYDGTTILIDTGRYNDSEKRIINYLNEEIGVGGNIDLLIFTHNDADHIGNGDLVLEYFQVDEVWMNGMDHSSQVYSDVLDTLLASDVLYYEPKKGYEADIGAFSVEVLHPLENETQNSQNNESIVTRITLEDTVLMHSGDVSKAVEKRLLSESSIDLQSDIMVLGHHGSNTSTSEEWLRAINPRVAVYQAGSDNHYGHPHRDILQLFDGHRAEVFGTDQNGTIHITVNEGNRLDMTTEEEE